MIGIYRLDGHRRPLPGAIFLLILTVCCFSPIPVHAQQNTSGLVLPDTSAISDVVTPLLPSGVHPGGLVGARFIASEKNRLLKVDEEELLGGFIHHPGSQAWIGEHVGKWLHAASLTYAYTGDPALKTKLDRVASRLMSAQEQDGYLGTYTADKRFGLYPNSDWDVWSHKYDLIGLLTYYQYTGNQNALNTCRRIGDLLINTFGPGKKSINSAGTMDGMAATSVLEPMVLLYRATNDHRYLDFAKYIVSAWDEQGGSRILSALLKGTPVYRVANAKAYEMTSNLVGLCELYRVTGMKKYITAVLNGWKDISTNRLYITGGGSSGELWREDYNLPNGQGSNICETCVTVTWMQLNMELLRLTGEARFAEELEKTLYNHLLGAQKPTCDDWSYYTPLQGIKRYDAVTTCCHSSGPRGLALAPSYLYTVTRDGISVNIFSASSVTTSLTGGGKVALKQITDYPLDGTVKLIVMPSGVSDPFSIHLRIPAWSSRISVAVNGKTDVNVEKNNGFITIRRTWEAGDIITYKVDVKPRILLGDHGNAGCMAVMYGPLVLAADLMHNRDKKTSLSNMTPAVDDIAKFRVKQVGNIKNKDLALFETDGIMYAPNAEKPSRCKIFLTPYYAAGADGSPLCVWMKRPEVLTSTPVSLFGYALESRSRAGNVAGSISDGVSESFVVTCDGIRQNEDWYALTLPSPVVINRVVFTQGKLFHDGGWFNTTAGKPRIQGQKTKDGIWEDLGILESYPATTDVSSAALQNWQEFEVSFKPVSVYAIRVIGTPSCGDNLLQSFSSCGELSAFGSTH